MSDFNLPIPGATPFMLWANLLVQELADYNLPNPVSEALWATWADQVYAVPAVVQLGAADPRGFPNWASWALTFLQVSN